MKIRLIKKNSKSSKPKKPFYYRHKTLTGIAGIIGFIFTYILILQHYFPISPYFSDYEISIISIRNPYDENATITINLINKWNDEEPLRIEIFTTPKLLLEYNFTCRGDCLAYYNEKVVSIKGHQAEGLDIRFEILDNY